MSGVSILIPTHNRAAILAQTLESLSQLKLPPNVDVEAVVVANACTDNTEAAAQEMASKLAFPLRYVSDARANLNIARNTAVTSSRYELLALLDDDVWVDSGWLESLVAAY